LQCRMECREVAAETLYDVLHDTEYRPRWDTNVIETFDIARLTANADLGYYSWRCPKPLRNRDVITLRSWLPMGSDYIIMNYSVKHPVRPGGASGGSGSSFPPPFQPNLHPGLLILLPICLPPQPSSLVLELLFLSLTPWAMKKLYKACLKYPAWKEGHQPHFKPWLYPEQCQLPPMALSELSLQHAESLENID
ncbi:STA10 protein, partial [Indicator maculatus]|nr:STA10 protein [Indicator maculatus]